MDIANAPSASMEVIIPLHPTNTGRTCQMTQKSATCQMTQKRDMPHDSEKLP